MNIRKARQPRPLDRAMLEQLALAYAARFATSEAKLAAYLSRKLRERGWADAADPDVAAIVERLADLRYVDDPGYARMKARGLMQRGYGARRVRAALDAGGIDRAVAEDALAEAQADDGGEDGDAAVAAARRLARRRRLGPWRPGGSTGDPAQRRREMAVLLRAGHDPVAARAALDGPGDGTSEP